MMAEGTLCFCCKYRWFSERERKAHNREAHNVKQGAKLRPGHPKVKPQLGLVLVPKSERGNYVSW